MTAQSFILYKTLPDSDYLFRLQRDGVLRAAATFLPGGCFAGAGVYEAGHRYAPPEPPSIDLDHQTTRVSGPVPILDCPFTDLLACSEWELWEALNKVSPAPPLRYNAFVVIRAEQGSRVDYLSHLAKVAGRYPEGPCPVERDGVEEYVAAAHLVGCGPYNVLIEVLAGTHDRLLERVVALTDHVAVAEQVICRFGAHQTRGFGSPRLEAALAVR